MELEGMQDLSERVAALRGADTFETWVTWGAVAIMGLSVVALVVALVLAL